ATDECFTVVKQPSTTDTQASTNATNVVPGTSVTDTATVSGSIGTPTGTVDFFLCQPSEVTGGGCEGTAGTKIGVTKTLASGQATSDATTNTTAIGKYCWRAEYTPALDSLYLASSHTDATNECFTVVSQATHGKTPGFWRNKNGHQILDANGDGNLDSPVTIGGGSRSFLVTTIAQSDKILSNSACGGGSPAIFACNGSGTGHGLSDSLKRNTLEELAAQTLALTYNIGPPGVPGGGFAGQTLSEFGATLPPELASLFSSSNPTVEEILAVANSLIANSTAAGSTTQPQAGAMNSLLGHYINSEG
ncbi:MAG: hypothetical protein MUP15_08675, partial [Dehalococcoidia bacterium]|nr:hypothetical protein [Dehalococcoidia bacterium]